MTITPVDLTFKTMGPINLNKNICRRQTRQKKNTKRKMIKRYQKAVKSDDNL